MLRLVQRLPIKHKLVAITMLASSIALVVACLAFFAYEQVTARKRIVQELLTTARMTGANSAAGLAFEDATSVEQILNALKVQPNIVSACVYDKAGQPFASYQRPGANKQFSPPPVRSNGSRFGKGTLEVFQGIFVAGEKAGTVYIAMDLGEMTARVWRYTTIVCGVLLASLLIAFVLSAWLQKAISGPLTGLARTVTRVAESKDYSMRAARQGEDELGRLIDGFNDMLAQIQQRDSALQAAREHLEHRVAERTQALANSVSLLNATLESTADGILAVDLAGKVVSYNNQFAAMWAMPAELLDARDRAKIAAFANAQTRDPESGWQRIEQLRAHPEIESFDLLELKDGRVFERYMKPQRVENELVGCVLNFRDVTDRQRAEERLRRTEELYRRAIAGADAVPYAYDYRTRTYLFMGEGIRKLLGYDPQELTPAVWQSIVQESVMQGETAGLDKAEAARRILAGDLRNWRCDMRVLTRDGKSRWVSDASVQNAGEAGRPIGSMGILMDITERKEAEAELAYERDLLKTLLDNLPDAIYFKDLQSRFVRCSKSMAQLFHQPACEALLGKTDADFFTPEHARPALEDEQTVIRTGQPILAKVERETHPGGRVTWALTSKMPWRDKDANIIGTFGASRDITPIKEAEAKLEAVHQQLVEASRQAGMAEVATSVLHNVGNVLNSVNVSASVLTDLVRAAKGHEIARVAALFEEHRNDLPGFLLRENRVEQLITYLTVMSQHMGSEQARMLDELQGLTTNISHIKEIVAMQQSYAKVCGVLEMQSVPALVEDALHMHLESLARREVTIVRQFDPVPSILADKHKFLQILVNLISNAKYALSECVAPERRLTLSVRLNGDGRVRVSVGDNGVGIAPENLTRIFSHGFTTRRDGHGFGLHSSALAARDMGGSLAAHSDGLGKGAIFTLELPLKPKGQPE